MPMYSPPNYVKYKTKKRDHVVLIYNLGQDATELMMCWRSTDREACGGELSLTAAAADDTILTIIPQVMMLDVI